MNEEGHSEEIHRLQEKIDSLTRELEAVVANRNKFFSLISHDLRAPFTGLLGLSEILANPRNELSKDKVLEMGKILHQSIRQQYEFIKNLSEWARFQQGKSFFNPEMINLKTLFEQCLRSWEAIISKQSFTVSYELNGDIQYKVDAYMLKTAVNHILSNAFRFTPANGKIRIWQETMEDELKITIQDNGTGIETGILENLFSMRALSVAKDLQGIKGSGLGLMITKDFLNHNGIQITVASAPSQGTSISLVFPLSNIFFLK